MDEFVKVIGDPMPRKTVILMRLEEIDAVTTKPRTTRELLLNNPGTISWVTGLDNEAAVLRAELSTL